MAPSIARNSDASTFRDCIALAASENGMKESWSGSAPASFRHASNHVDGAATRELCGNFMPSRPASVSMSSRSAWVPTHQ